MAIRWAFLVGIVAITQGCRDKAPDPAARGSADLTAASRVPTSTPKPPSLGADAGVDPSLPAPPRQSADATFTAQARDVEWAPSTETELRRRFTKIRGAKLEDAECRQSQCRLVIAGNEGDVGRTIADLESNRGLHGFAANVLLTTPERKSDGTLVLRAFAMFER